jgi:putative AlgH/UPF0301 family transcriptional regulator
MAGSSWVTAPLDRELIFTADVGQMWERAIRSLGIDPLHLSSEISDATIH